MRCFEFKWITVNGVNGNKKYYTKKKKKKTKTITIKNEIKEGYYSPYTPIKTLITSFSPVLNLVLSHCFIAAQHHNHNLSSISDPKWCAFFSILSFSQIPIPLLLLFSSESKNEFSYRLRRRNSRTLWGK